MDYSLLSIKVNYYDYLRGQVFIDDIKRVFEEDCPADFELGSLISLLHDDFIYHTQKGERSHEQTAQYLAHGHARYLAPATVKKETRQLKKVGYQTFVFEDDIEEEEIDNKEEMVFLDLRIKETKLRRSEILLHDVSEYLEERHITVEEMIMILYLDFISRIKKEGNSIKVMKAILKGVDFHN